MLFPYSLKVFVSESNCGKLNRVGLILWWSFGTEHLSPAVFETLGSKRIGVTALTFRGHVMLPVT